MTSRTTWKNAERIVASWFGTLRNPLSGRNNRADDGSRRLGDTLYAHAVVEVKCHQKNAVISRAKETAALAKANGKPWLHIEKLTGDSKIFALVLDRETIETVVIPALRGHWEGASGKYLSDEVPVVGAIHENYNTIGDN